MFGYSPLSIVFHSWASVYFTCRNFKKYFNIRYSSYHFSFSWFLWFFVLTFSFKWTWKSSYLASENKSLIIFFWCCITWLNSNTEDWHAIVLNLFILEYAFLSIYSSLTLCCSEVFYSFHQVFPCKFHINVHFGNFPLITCLFYSILSSMWFLFAFIYCGNLLYVNLKCVILFFLMFTSC